MSSRLPRTIGATSSSTSPSSGWAAASRSPWPRRPRRAVAQPEAHEAPLGLVGDRVAAQLDHDRVPDGLGRGDRRVGVDRGALVENGHAVSREQRLGVDLGQRAHMSRCCSYGASSGPASTRHAARASGACRSRCAAARRGARTRVAACSWRAGARRTCGARRGRSSRRPSPGRLRGRARPIRRRGCRTPRRRALAGARRGRPRSRRDRC